MGLKAFECGYIFHGKVLLNPPSLSLLLLSPLKRLVLFHFWSAGRETGQENVFIGTNTHTAASGLETFILLMRLFKGFL